MKQILKIACAAAMCLAFMDSAMGMNNPFGISSSDDETETSSVHKQRYTKKENIVIVMAYNDGVQQGLKGKSLWEFIANLLRSCELSDRSWSAISQQYPKIPADLKAMVGKWDEEQCYYFFKNLKDIHFYK